MKKVGLIGSGYWGANLVRNFNALGCLGAVCDKDSKVLAQIKSSYPDILCLSNFDQLLNRNGLEIDGIVIATPAETHYQVAKKALLSGKHVFVEKPLALIESEGQELVELAEKNEKALMVGHILQYHPAILKLKELIDSGQLGKIQYIYSNRLNMGKIRSEENILWSFAPHDISVMLMLLEEFPLSITSTGGNYVQSNIADVTMTMLNFPSGVKGHIFVSWLHPFKEQKLIAVGDKKMAVFDDLSDQKLLVYPHSIEWHHRQPVAVKAEAEIVSLNSMEPLRVECQHFIDCISNGKKPKTDGREGLRVLKILNACETSLRSGGVKIDLFSNHIGPETSISSGRDNRRILDSTIQAKPEEKCFIHESCYLDEDVNIGEGTKIWHYSHILKNSQIGRFCNIGQNAVIGPDVTIGDRCKIQNNVSIFKGVTLEDEVFCGPSMVFTNVFNPRASIRRMDEIRLTLVKKGATIGANATIICGVTIGRYALVGAGSVVTKDVDDYAIVVGNPAFRTGWVCECGVKLNGDLVCEACGKKYAKTDGERESITPQS